MRHINLRAYFPNPLNFLLLFVVWLLLTQRFTYGNLFLAEILAWLIPLSVNRIRMARAPVRKPRKMVSFLRLLLGDIIISNIVKGSSPLLAFYDRFGNFVQSDGKFTIPCQLFFHALHHAADRAVVVDTKLRADFF